MSIRAQNCPTFEHPDLTHPQRAELASLAAAHHRNYARSASRCQRLSSTAKGLCKRVCKLKRAPPQRTPRTLVATHRPPLPKLNVEGSNPFARFGDSDDCAEPQPARDEQLPCPSCQMNCCVSVCVSAGAKKLLLVHVQVREVVGGGGAERLRSGVSPLASPSAPLEAERQLRRIFDFVIANRMVAADDAFARPLRVARAHVSRERDGTFRNRPHTRGP